eukprot:3766626-Pyramimonas_sp.AAC.1
MSPKSPKRWNSSGASRRNQRHVDKLGEFDKVEEPSGVIGRENQDHVCVAWHPDGVECTVEHDEYED